MSDFPWDDLLIKIRDRKVVPIVGDGIQVAENQSVSRFLPKSLASRLRSNYHVDTGLRDVSGSFIGNRGRIWRVCLPMDDRAALSGRPTSPYVLPDYGSLNWGRSTVHAMGTNGRGDIFVGTDRELLIYGAGGWFDLLCDDGVESLEDVLSPGTLDLVTAVVHPGTSDILPTIRRTTPIDAPTAQVLRTTLAERRAAYQMALRNLRNTAPSIADEVDPNGARLPRRCCEPAIARYAYDPPHDQRSHDHSPS